MVGRGRRSGPDEASRAPRRRRRSPSRAPRARTRAGPRPGSRCAGRPRAPPRSCGPRRAAARGSRARRGSRRTSRGPRPGRSRRARCRGRGTLPRCRMRASRSGVCPPSWAITPDRLLRTADRQHVLGRERLEVEPARGVVVGRDGLGVRVHHHRLEPGLLEGERGVHACVVELDALADPVRAGPEDDDARPDGRSHLVFLLVGREVVGRAGGELPRARVDGLEDGRDAEGVAVPANRGLGRAREHGEARVGQPGSLRMPQLASGQRRQWPSSNRSGLVDDLRDLLDEPRVDAGGGRDVVDTVPGVERPFDQVQAFLGGDGERRQQVLCSHRPLPGDVPPPRSNPAFSMPAPRLAQRLLEGSTDRHDLADRLHRRGQARVGLGELLEREPRHLDDDVVERRFERCGGLARDVVHDLVQAVADGEQRGDLRDREPGRLRRERARARHPGVHLDQHLSSRRRIDRELHVRAAGLHADHPQHLQRRVAHLLILTVGQGLLRGDGDRVAGVHPHRVDVLDRADDDAVVVGVAHHLELELLPAGDRLLDEDLRHRRDLETACGERRELLAVGGEPAAAPTHRERGPHDQRVADRVPERQRLVDGGGGAGPRHIEPCLQHRVLEAAPVLGAVDRFERGTDQRDAEPVEIAGLRERDRDVQCGLAAERREQRIGAFPLADREDRPRRERLDVRAVGELGVGHDRRRVRVHQGHLEALAPQHLACLGARVVELAGLSDHDRSRPDHHDLVEVGPLRHHGPFPGRRHQPTELVEEIAGVVRARARPPGGTAR